MTDAHSERLTLHLVIAYPAHPERRGDPHYAAFNAARRRLERLGKLACWIGGPDCAGAIELHHNLIEYALINDVDRVKLALDHPQFTTDDDQHFLDLVEGPDNLLPLCVYHHRGHGGVHVLPEPLWLVQRYLRAGIAAPAREVSRES